MLLSLLAAAVAWPLMLVTVAFPVGYVIGRRAARRYKARLSASKAQARLPTWSEAAAMVDSAHERGLKEALEKLGKKPSLASLPASSSTTSPKFPTAAALVMAGAARRMAVKHGDFGLARAAKKLRDAAEQALAKRQSILPKKD